MTTTKLDERLREIAAGLARDITAIVCAMTVDELLTLSAGGNAPAVEARSKKTRPAPKGRPKTRRKTRTSQKPAGKKRTAPTGKTTSKQPATRPAPEAVSTESTVSAVSTEPPPPSPPAPPQSRHVPAEALAKAGSLGGGG